jgi:hypothetical protein
MAFISLILNNTFIGFQAGPGTATQLTNATAIGANALVCVSITLVLGAPGFSVAIGASTAATTLQVAGDIRIGTNRLYSGLGGGPLAAPVQSSLSESVYGHGYKAVNYSQLPLLLLQAVRELQTEVQAPKARK